MIGRLWLCKYGIGWRLLRRLSLGTKGWGFPQHYSNYTWWKVQIRSSGKMVSARKFPQPWRTDMGMACPGFDLARGTCSFPPSLYPWSHHSWYQFLTLARQLYILQKCPGWSPDTNLRDVRQENCQNSLNEETISEGLDDLSKVRKLGSSWARTKIRVMNAGSYCRWLLHIIFFCSTN